METAFRSEERFTQEQFWCWLQERPVSDVGRYELIRGRIVMSPPAGWPHAAVGVALSARLHFHVRALRLGMVFDASAGFDLPSGDTLEPDVSFVSSARLAAGPAPVRGRFLRVVPELVIEILSDSTAKRDRGEKKEIYAENGVEEYWLVDTDRRQVTLLFREGEELAAAQTVSQGRIPSRLLPGMEMSIDDIFADLP